MRLLLLKDIRKLGNLGDVVEVTTGYARNYLIPQRLATEPTEENIKAIEQEKKRAAAERAARLKVFTDLAEKMKDVQVTIEAAANPEGTLYGSVGRKEVADALHALGFAVRAEQIELDPPIRTLDNRTVTIRFTDELSTDIKVWVVKEGGAEHGEHAEEQGAAASRTEPA
ncbi:MAG: 50S ribosomal protein L9 [Phycisphaerae bacterium]|jgi:large subunit ribosomal protein L9|nr:50S ribosomal protein L9 [Phycisphaerae bacterium]HOO17491.1 50S ribosomal protein L9 [Phycisphaerae bacterium]HPC22946.1 50S ribosomal protein L9 [Phycisphaerae bacterium]HRS29036.1 50S ribosomal protein L9 [Phycisphaerae bacterium]HRT42869.1 50S ribosomal protein L9 [Phycisphaerae bacterium]